MPRSSLALLMLAVLGWNGCRSNDRASAVDAKPRPGFASVAAAETIFHQDCQHVGGRPHRENDVTLSCEASLERNVTREMVIGSRKPERVVSSVSVRYSHDDAVPSQCEDLDGEVMRYLEALRPEGVDLKRIAAEAELVPDDGDREVLLPYGDALVRVTRLETRPREKVGPEWSTRARGYDYECEVIVTIIPATLGDGVIDQR